MTKPLTQKDIDAYQEAKQEYAQREETIIDRLDHILDVICKAFGYERKKIVSTWYFHGAGEGEMGQLNLDYSDIAFSIELKSGKNWDCCQTDRWDYFESFPKKFLFMTDEQITDQIKEEIEEAKRKKAERAEKAKKRRQEKDILKAKAKSKLTPAERKALGIK